MVAISFHKSVFGVNEMPGAPKIIHLIPLRLSARSYFLLKRSNVLNGSSPKNKNNTEVMSAFCMYQPE